MITQKQIEDARDQVSNGHAVVHLGGYSAANVNEFESVVRHLTDAGQVEGATFTADYVNTPRLQQMLGDTAQISSANVIKSPGGHLGVSLGLHPQNLSAEDMESVREMLATMEPNDFILAHDSTMDMFERSLEDGELDTRTAGLVRDVFRGPWRHRTDADALSGERSFASTVTVGDAQVNQVPDEPATPESPEVPASNEPVADLPVNPAPAEIEEVDSDLPKNFPGRAKLIAAGHINLADVRAIPTEELTKVPGIKAATAGLIIAALGTTADA